MKKETPEEGMGEGGERLTHLCLGSRRNERFSQGGLAQSKGKKKKAGGRNFRMRIAGEAEIIPPQLIRPEPGRLFLDLLKRGR